MSTTATTPTTTTTTITTPTTTAANSITNLRNKVNNILDFADSISEIADVAIGLGLFSFLIIIGVCVYKFISKTHKYGQCIQYIYDRRHRVGGEGNGESNLLDLNSNSNSMAFENPMYNFNVSASVEQELSQIFDVEHPNPRIFDVEHPNHPIHILEENAVLLQQDSGSGNNDSVEVEVEICKSKKHSGIDGDQTIPMLKMGNQGPRRSPRINNMASSTL